MSKRLNVIARYLQPLESCIRTMLEGAGEEKP